MYGVGIGNYCCPGRDEVVVVDIIVDGCVIKP